MIFSVKNYSQLKKSLSRKHIKETKTLLLELKKWDPAFYKIISRFDFTKFSSLHFFLKEEMRALLFYLKNSKKLSTNPESFLEIDDIIFERWNASEFSGDFLKALNKGCSMAEAHEAALNNYKSHLSVLFERFLHSTDSLNEHYRIQTSLGETGSKKPKKLLHSIINIEGKFLDIYAHSLKEFKSFSARIELALKLIKVYSPSSWDRFCAFSEVIIPIKNPEFVSFSHQQLPGYSMINLYDRDFVDLLDDLLHENGHHHLNYYLNFGRLIEEPKELLYYSPWRKSPRPLRGIYHAYFTFFWAYQLFRDLILNKETVQGLYQFSKDEWQKIYTRVVEEYYMLQFSFEDLKRASKKGLIYSKGQELIEFQQNILKKDKKFIGEWEKKIKRKSTINKLKKELKIARQEY